MCTQYKKLYSIWLNSIDYLKDLFLLIIRLYWGYGFFNAGLGKFNNFERTTNFFQSLNIPFPEVNVVMAAGTELVGGILLFLGLGSRIITVPLIFTMLVAYITADTDAILNVFSKPEDFTSAEPFMYLFVSLIVLCFGSGRVSLDRVVSKYFCK